jgi:hypothetical protein
MATKFDIGKLEVTKAAEKLARRLFGNIGATSRLAGLLARHSQGDWGDLNRDGKLHNDDAVVNGGRIFSAYDMGGGDEFWIITEADRLKTTIMLPTDF